MHYKTEREQEEVENYVLTFVNGLALKYARLNLTDQEADDVYDKEIIGEFIPAVRSMGVFDLPPIVALAIENIIRHQKV